MSKALEIVNKIAEDTMIPDDDEKYSRKHSKPLPGHEFMSDEDDKDEEKDGDKAEEKTAKKKDYRGAMADIAKILGKEDFTGKRSPKEEEEDEMLRENSKAEALVNKLIGENYSMGVPTPAPKMCMLPKPKACMLKKKKAVKEATESAIGDMPMSELVYTWLDKNNSWQLGGESGLHNVERLTRALGYDNIDNFLEDNSGALQAIVEWISGQDNEEWRENLEKNLTPDSDDVRDTETVGDGAVEMADIESPPLQHPGLN